MSASPETELRPSDLYDHVHLFQKAVPLFTKTLKDVTEPNRNTHQEEQSREFKAYSDREAPPGNKLSTLCFHPMGLSQTVVMCK